MAAVAESCFWQFTWRSGGPLRNLTFGDNVEEIEFSDSRGAQVAIDDRSEIACERLHPRIAKWNFRPVTAVQEVSFVAGKRTTERGFDHPQSPLVRSGGST